MIRVLLIVLSVALAVGCGADASSPESYTTEDGRLRIEFWHAMGGQHAQALNGLIDSFNESQDEYTVVGIYQGQYQTLSQKLIASLYAGTPPACSQMYESWTSRFIRANCLRPIAEFAGEDPEWGEEDIQDFVDPFREDNTYEVEGKSVLATLPFNKSIYVLCVNQDLMEELGFDGPPATWDDLRRLSRAMTLKDETGRFERYGFATRPLIEAFTVLLMSAGANYMDEEENFTFAGEEGRAAFRLLTDLVLGDNRSGYIESDYLSTFFGQQVVGMYITSTASFPYNDSAVGNKFIWRAYPVPHREGAQARTLSQGTNVGIFGRGYTADSSIPESVQQGAWEFVKFLTSRDSTAKWSIETGYMPVRKSALNHPAISEYKEKNINFANALSVLDQAEFEPKPVWWENVRLVFQREVEAALNGRKTPDQALDSALRKCETIRMTAG